MCHFITGVLSKGGDAEAVGTLAEAHGFQWAPMANPTVQKQLTSGETYFLTTRGMCDCGTSLGWIGRKTPAHSLDEALTQQAQALRKKGWSNAKVERWIETRRAVEQRQSRTDDQTAPTHEGDLQRWVHFLCEVIETQASAGIGILLHWYRGGIDSERIQLKDRLVVPVDGLSTTVLGALEEDMLCMVVRNVRR